MDKRETAIHQDCFYFLQTNSWMGSHALWDSANQLRQRLEFPLCNHPNNPTPYISQKNICFEQYQAITISLIKSQWKSPQYQIVSTQWKTLFVCWSEVQWDTIHTVPGISGSFEAFSSEHMAQMSSTRCTSDFNTPTILIPCFCDGTRKAFKESRPATAGIKFGCRLVQWSSTCSTLVQSIFLVLVILPCSCPFGAFLTKDAELLRTKHGSPFLLSLLHSCNRGCGWCCHRSYYY